LQSFVLLSCFS